MAEEEKVNERDKVRSIYGRGFVDGLRTAGVTNIGEFMNAAKIESAERHISAAARKVLDAVPVGECWTSRQITTEIGKMSGSHMEIRVVDGCLESLKGDGLVKETQRGLWQRVAPRPKVVLAPKTVEITTVAESAREGKEATPTKTNPLDQMGELAAGLRALASSLTRMADNIESAALEMASQVQAAKEENKRLEQLRELLRSF